MNLSIIVAISENNAIGKNNELLWHLPQDLKRFKAITTGHTIIMGRKTFDSIGKPLPNRRSVVITRDENFHHEGVTVVHSIKEALATVASEKEVFIIGGGEIYKETLPLVDKIYLTTVHKSFEADTFFPKIDLSQWAIIEEEKLPQDEKNKLPASFQILQRKPIPMQIKDLESFKAACANTLLSHLDIEFMEVTADSITARMPVNEKTLNPLGFLHGGASLALLETVGSSLSVFHTDIEKNHVFGMNVNANHLKPAQSGFVYATATFLHKGTKTQVVNVVIRNEKGETVCDGRITNIVFPKTNA